MTNVIPTLPDELRMMLGEAKTLVWCGQRVSRSHIATNVPCSDDPIEDEGRGAQKA